MTLIGVRPAHVLIVAILLVAACSSRRNEPASLVEKIEALHGQAVVDEQAPDRPVVRVGFVENTPVPAALDCVAGLPKLQALEFYNTPVQDGDLVRIGKLSGLKTLFLRRASVSDDGLKHLAGLQSLEVLSLEGVSKISDGGLLHLRSLPKLRLLAVGGGTKITDVGLLCLARFESLDTISVPHTSLTDVGLSYLEGSKRLRELSIEYTKITDVGLASLGTCENLESLHLDGTAITDTGLRHLSALRMLKTLSLSHTTIGDPGLKCLVDLPRLETLFLDSTPATNAGIGDLKKALPKLRVIRLEK